MDSLALKLVIRDQTENIAFDSLALTVTKVDGSNFRTTSLSIADPSNPQVITTEVQSNPSNILNVSGSHTRNLFFILPFIQITKGLQRQVRAVESSTPLAKITLPASLTESLSMEEKKMASRVQFTFFQKSTFFQVKLGWFVSSYI